MLLVAVISLTFISCKKGEVYKTLIVTGQSEENWKVSSPILKQILEETGLFDCKIITTPEAGGDMSSFNPDFSKYKLVVIDYDGDSWTEKTKKNFVDYVNNGGGVVVYHSSCISFPDWKEYNEMTGLGGWKDRNEKDGPYVYYSRDQLVVDTTAGPAGTVSKPIEFTVTDRITDHPVTQGLPVKWMHASDELYGHLRGPAKNMLVLATASASSRNPYYGPAGREDPVLLAINYGNGRIFNTLLGYADDEGAPALHCAGFIVTLQRGAEWAASGTVTQAVPFDFPSAAAVASRPDYKSMTVDDVFANIGNYDITKSTKYYVALQSFVRSAAGDDKKLLDLEKKMTDVLSSDQATIESKKLILRELSWMGSDYSIPVIKSLEVIPELKDDVNFALTRLQQ